MSRQQRRKLRRDLTARGQRLLARGLPKPLSNDDALAVALVLSETFSSTAIETRAARLAEAAEALLDRTMAHETKALAYACRKGCGWCCWQRVICTAPEIFRVAEWMRANVGSPGLPALAAIATADAMPLPPATADNMLRRQPCALLVDNACSIHPGRPLPCRAVLSMAADACRGAMADPAKAGPVPLVMSGMDAAETVRTLMLTALSVHGLPDSGYDLTKALLIVLPDPDAEKRWLSGEDVLASVRVAPRPPQSQAAQNQLAGMIRSLAEQ